MFEKPIGHCTLEQLAVLVHVVPGEDRVPIYIAPPKREWVGLTEDDIAQAMCRADAIFTGPMQFKFAKELEAKLKEKNT
jgi:hypothetical protein